MSSFREKARNFLARTFGAPAAVPRQRGVNFVGPVDFVSGLGTSARGYVAALNYAGVPLHVVPWTRGFEHQRRIGETRQTGALGSISVVHLNLDTLTLWSLLDVAPLSTLRQHSYTVAVVYWELDTIKPEWLPVVRRFDEFWCASSFMAAAISKVFPGPVHVVRPALQLGSWTHSRTRKDFGLPEDRYVFFYTCDAGSVLGRKNPHALLNAFRDEFREDEGALCVIRVIYGEHNRDGVDQIRAMTGNRSDIVVMDELWSEEELRDFFAVIDCYVSPHRSEGLGLTIIDAMAAGKPVIATPYGGCADIVRADTALPLDYRIVPVGDGNQPYPPDAIWADPSVASIRAQMRKAFDHRHEAQDIGQRGNAEVRRLFGFEPAAARIGEAVAEIERRQSRP